MVYNNTRCRRFAGNSSTHSMKGKGMGSVVIRMGGPGAGSSYMDLQDYMDTTGNNPDNYVEEFTSRMGGGRISRKLSSKLGNLKLETGKRKNIVMSF